MYKVTKEVIAEINAIIEQTNFDPHMMFNDVRGKSKSAVREFLANQRGYSFWSKEEKPAPKITDPCPNCGKQLESQSRGGVMCPDKECGYWFCY